MNNKNKGFTLIELLGVIVILGIVTTLAVQGFHKYIIKGRSTAYNIAEKSLKAAGKAAVIDCLSLDSKEVSQLSATCTSNTDNPKCFCNSHNIPDDQFGMDFLYLDELVAAGYTNNIKDPKNSEEFCNQKSYVYVAQKADTDIQNNAKYEYKTCLICGDYKSKDCLDDSIIHSDEITNAFKTVCRITTDSAGNNPYDGKWTRNDLYLQMSVDDDTKTNYGISYFTYKIGDSQSIKVGAVNNKEATVPLSTTMNDVEIRAFATDGIGKKTTEVKCGTSNVKIDKEDVKGVKINAKRESSGTEITSGTWTNENVVLYVTANPKSVPSGYQYKYYKDGVAIGDWSANSSYTATVSGTYKVEIRNTLNTKQVMSTDYVVKIDKVKPTCTVVVTGSPSKVGNYYTQSINLGFGTKNDADSDVASATLDTTSITSDTIGKVVTGTIRDNAGNSNTCSLTVNVDMTTPTIKAKSGTVTPSGSYAFTSNVTATYGPAGGTTTCNPANSRGSGSYTVTCTATGANGKTASVSFTAKHSYQITHTCNGYPGTCDFGCYPRNGYLSSGAYLNGNGYVYCVCWYDCHSAKSYDYQTITPCPYGGTPTLASGGKPNGPQESRQITINCSY